jgi:hypothetical protein
MLRLLSFRTEPCRCSDSLIELEQQVRHARLKVGQRFLLDCADHRIAGLIHAIACGSEEVAIEILTVRREVAAKSRELILDLRREPVLPHIPEECAGIAEQA